LTLRRTVTLLGSTGSIGVSTLDLLEQATAHGSAQVEVVALTAGRNVNLLIEQCLKWRPQFAVIADESEFYALRNGLVGTGIGCGAGASAVVEAAAMDAQWVMSAIVGFAGLAPTLEAARRGAIIALANKESLVCAGPALIKTARQAGGTLIPVDSEHSAIFQVLRPDQERRVSRLILTASGGPFRTWTRDAMVGVTPEQAIAHPNWSMGAKISVDSATMMNKGLEMIEASYLFAMGPEMIDVVIHPQSVIHSLVEYQDGSTLAQLGAADMRSPIAVAYAWPDRLPWPAPALDLVAFGPLTFEAPDLEKFPAIATARAALVHGGAAPTVMNAANEVAVAAFLERRLGFLDIAATVDLTLDKMNGLGQLETSAGDDIMETAMMVDASARRVATDVVAGFARSS
jgi:1-deoxy-D-xylulose-5-phosphate reductoisomerase